MKNDAIKEARVEAERFLKRVRDYERTVEVHKVMGQPELNISDYEYVTCSPMVLGALRRSSLDLSRALAKMRRPE